MANIIKLIKGFWPFCRQTFEIYWLGSVNVFKQYIYGDWEEGG